MFVRLTIVLLTGLLSLTLAFAWTTAQTHTHKLNQQHARWLSQTARLLSRQIKQTPHPFDAKHLKHLLQSTRAGLKPHPPNQSVFIVNRFGRILAHFHNKQTGRFLPLSSPLLPLLKQAAQNPSPPPPLQTSRTLTIVRPLPPRTGGQTLKSFIVVQQKLSQTWPVFLAFLKTAGPIAAGGFLFLWMGIFLCLRRFTKASRFVFNTLALINTNEHKRQTALFNLTHSPNPYLKPVRKILKHLLAAQKPALPKPKKEIYFSDLIEQITRQMQIIYPHLRIKTFIDADITLPVFKEYLFQALWELIKNSAQAKEQNNLITIRTFKKDDWFCCELSDQGPGMSEPIIKKAFEPYFSTKQKAVGMGLTLTENTLARLGGLVQLHSPAKPTNKTTDKPANKKPETEHSPANPAAKSTAADKSPPAANPRAENSQGLTVALLIPLDYIEHIQKLKKYKGDLPPDEFIKMDHLS